MDRLVCGDVGFGKTEVAHPGRVQGRAGRQAGRRCSCPRRCSPSQHFQTFSERFASYPVRVEVLSRFLTPAQARRVVAASPPARSTSSSAPTGSSPTTSRSRTSACSSSTRSSASASAQGADQGAAHRRRRAHAVRHARSPGPSRCPHRHPRSHAGEHPARGPPADPHLRRRVRRPRRRRGHPARAAAGGPGLLRAQPGAGHRVGRRARSATSCPRRGSPSRTARWTRAASSRSCSTSGNAIRRACLHDDHRVGHRHADREHARRRPADRLGLGQLHQLRGRVGRPASAPTPTCSTRATGRCPRRPTSG